MPDPRKMQVNLLGFMDKYGAAHFTETLWNLLISAQNTVGGVPAEVSDDHPSVSLADQAVHRGEKEGDSDATSPRPGSWTNPRIWEPPTSSSGQRSTKGRQILDITY